MTGCDGCVHFMEHYEGYDKEKMRSIWKRWCLLDKDYDCNAGTCWEEPRCDLDIFDDLSIDHKYDIMLDIENIKKSAQELLGKVTERGFDVRAPLKTGSYTVTKLRDIITQMDYLLEEFGRRTVGE